MAEGAEPLKPLNEIPSAVILITNSVVAGFRGEKNDEKMQSVRTGRPSEKPLC